MPRQEAARKENIEVNADEATDGEWRDKNRVGETLSKKSFSRYEVDVYRRFQLVPSSYYNCYLVHWTQTKNIFLLLKKTSEAVSLTNFIDWRINFSPLAVFTYAREECAY